MTSSTIDRSPSQSRAATCSPRVGVDDQLAVLASLGTCAGLYALRFCQQRGIAIQGLGLTLTTEKDPEWKRLALVRLEIELPDGFPEKYREALIRSVDQCAVKRHILAPPRFEVVTVAGRSQPEMVEV